jgi:hypothetical protein
MKNLLCILAAIPLLLTGCVTPQQVVQPTSRVFSAPKEKVWPAIVSEIGLDYPVKAVEKDSGLITTEFVSVPAGYNNEGMSQWVLPPGGFLSTWDGLRVTLSAVVEEVEPGKTQVNLRAHYEAFESNVSKSWIICQSNGNLENQIFDKIAARLNSQKIIEASHQK